MRKPWRCATAQPLTLSLRLSPRRALALGLLISPPLALVLVRAVQPVFQLPDHPNARTSHSRKHKPFPCTSHVPSLKTNTLPHPSPTLPRALTINPQALEEIGEFMASSRVAFKWEAGDVLFLHNHLAMHVSATVTPPLPPATNSIASITSFIPPPSQLHSRRPSPLPHLLVACFPSSPFPSPSSPLA